MELIPKHILHECVVPWFRTVVWTMGLLLSLFGDGLFSFVNLLDSHDVKSWAFWCIYVIFVLEFLIVVVDQKIQYSEVSFNSKILWLIIRYSFVMFGVVVSWLLYDKLPRGEGMSPYLLLMILFACLQKKQEVSFPNNIEKYLDRNRVHQFQTRAA